MKGRAALVAGLAGLTSLGLHGGGVMVYGPDEPQSLSGGPTQIAMIGNSFEDAVTTVADPVPPPAARPVTAEAPEADTTPIPVEPTTTTAAVIPNAAPVLPVAPTAAVSSTPTPVTPPVRPEPETAASPEPERIAAEPDPVVQTPDADTPRPAPRVIRETPPPPEPAPVAEAPQATPQPPAVRGQADGQAQGTAPETTQGGNAQSAGNGRAIARYPQQVNRHLSRLRRPNANFSGAAVVSFTIAGNGGLSSVSLASSSGDASFDQLAIAHVQRAAPFPAPPSGAQRTFAVSIEAR